jgi:nucleoside-diphosphate-sugar epimerase
MRILITGAGGFIGKACVSGFSQRGWKVRAASSAVRPSAGVETVNVGVIDGETDWGPHLKCVDVVLHLAGIAHQPKMDTRAYLRANVETTGHLARAATDAGVSRFIFVSSIAVYGRRTATHVLDDATPLSPEDAYGRSKAHAEEALERAARGTSMAWTVVRPPLVYGPNAPGNFRRLVELVRRGVPLPLAAATSPRSYIGLVNLVSALDRAAHCPEAENRAFVISDAERTGTAQLIRWIAQGLGRPPRLFWVPEVSLRVGAAICGRAGDAARLLDPLQIDSRGFRDAVRWQPPVSLEEGVLSSVRNTEAA